MNERWLFLVRRGMIGLKKSSRSTGRMCVLKGVASADVGRLWMGLLLLLRVVWVERGAYFVESVRSCWQSCCVLRLVCLRRTLRVRGKSRSWSHVDGADAGEAWGVERVAAAGVAVA